MEILVIPFWILLDLAGNSRFNNWLKWFVVIRLCSHRIFVFMEDFMDPGVFLSWIAIVVNCAKRKLKRLVMVGACLMVFSALGLATILFMASNLCLIALIFQLDQALTTLVEEKQKKIISWFRKSFYFLNRRLFSAYDFPS